MFLNVLFHVNTMIILFTQICIVDKIHRCAVNLRNYCMLVHPKHLPIFMASQSSKKSSSQLKRLSALLLLNMLLLFASQLQLVACSIFFEIIMFPGVVKGMFFSESN